MGSSKHRWKIYFHKSPSHNNNNIIKNNIKKIQPPKEFMCPISRTLMLDPVIVATGHTFERNCVEACKYMSCTPSLPDGSVPDFSAIIPNLALKSTILNWCQTHLTYIQKPIDFDAAQKLVQEYIINHDIIPFQQPQKTTELSHISTSSDESVTAVIGTGLRLSATPLPLTTRPSCYSSSSSSEVESLNAGFLEEEELLAKLRSSQIFEQGEALVLLRKITRTQEESRARLCTPRILATLKSLALSKYMSIQVNAVAILVNLSLDKGNKVKIVRSGVVPPLIDVLKGGFLESQDHAAGALFSLALEDQNKTAIGVLGGLQPLLHSLRSESERTRHDSALALYHLTLVQSNRAKLVKFGGVQSLLGMVRLGHMTSRVLLVLCNLASSLEGRAAMLDGGSVECFIEMLKDGVFDSESTKESCVSALYGLSQGGLRFKAMAKEAGAEEILKKLEEMGSERSREKARKVLEVLREKDEDDEEVDWEELLNSEDDTSQTR
ncbi:hypothetical protein Leryth_006885 [Lithospermum erythrorhizon]|nr:hypothetical protein Leryth_006885 [Lithospermum erythrorhizon]